MYADAAPEEKCMLTVMLTVYIVKALTLPKGYDIKIELNIPEDQYLSRMERVYFD